MFSRLRTLFAKPVDKVARAAADAVPTQAIGAHNQTVKLATLNGLRVAVSPEKRAAFDAKLAEARVAAVLQMKGSA